VGDRGGRGDILGAGAWVGCILWLIGC
jgi:hypothetical protein